MWCLLLCGLGVLSVLALPATTQETKSAVKVQSKAAAERSEYEKWVEPYRSRPVKSRFGDEVSRVEVALIAIEGDEQKPDKRQTAHFLNNKIVTYGCYVSTSGRVGYFYADALGAKGGGYPQVSESDLKRLKQLLRKLSDDGSQLPPAGRRLVVQVADSDHFLVRVYDRANAPAQVLDILRLTGSGIRSYLPEFKPVSQWKANEFNDGALCLSPDGRCIISSSMYGPLKFWDIDTYKMVREVATPSDVPVTGLFLSPDGSTAALEGWGEISLLDTQTWQRFRKFAEPMIKRKQNSLSFPQFTLDGHFLLLQSSQPELQIFNTQNWERRKTLPDLPKDALAYVPAAGTSRAIYLSQDGTVALWDAHQHREIAKLDHNAHIHNVAFSPDKSLVAVATVHKGVGGYWTNYRIRIWNTDTGGLVHELRPFEQKTCEAIEGLLWSPDGRYILAATKANSFFSSFGIDVWSVKSGRHRGEFSGCPTKVTGLVLLPDGRLIAGCDDGIIRVWNAASAFKAITTFEESF